MEENNIEDSIENLKNTIDKVKEAQKIFSTFSERFELEVSDLHGVIERADRFPADIDT